MSKIKLHKRVKYAGDVFFALVRHGWSCTKAAAIIAIVPDADAVEVVRCKDCRWYQIRKPTLDDTPEYDCRRTHGLFCAKPDDFCSYGERKTDAE